MSLTLPETINFCLDFANIAKFSVQQNRFGSVVWQAPQYMKLLGNLTIWRAVLN